MKLDELIAWYTTLTPDTVDRVAEFYSQQARFRDPFNEVTGHKAIAAIFHHMFETTEHPRFEVTDKQCEAQTAWVSWTFRCRLAGRNIEIEGSSRLDFNEAGLVSQHHDYWDATELFARLPLIGTITKMIKSKMRAPNNKNESL